MQEEQADNVVEFPTGAEAKQPETKPGVCYIAGPMTGYPDYNFAAFLAAGAVLKQDGWEVLNPAEHDLECGFDPRAGVPPTDEQLDEFRKWDMAAVERCDKVFALNGWMGSVGAVAEVAHAQWMRKPVQQIAVAKDPETGGIQFGLGPEAPSIAGILRYVEEANANM